MHRVAAGPGPEFKFESRAGPSRRAGRHGLGRTPSCFGGLCQAVDRCRRPSLSLMCCECCALKPVKYIPSRWPWRTSMTRMSRWWYTSTKLEILYVCICLYSFQASLARIFVLQICAKAPPRPPRRRGRPTRRPRPPPPPPGHLEGWARDVLY